MHLNDKNTLCDFYRYRGTPQGSVQARTLTRCSRKSPSVMAFLACMSRDFGIFMPKHLAVQWLLNSYKKLQITGKTVICRKKDIVIRGESREAFGIHAQMWCDIFHTRQFRKDLKSPHFLKKQPRFRRTTGKMHLLLL